MMNTNFGLGILIAARDQASAIMGRIAGSLAGAAAASAHLNNQLMASRALFTTGAGLLGIGAAMLAPLTAGIVLASQFQYGLTEVNTLMQHSTKQMDAMGMELLNVMTKYGGNYQEQTKGLYQVVSSGVATLENGAISAAKAIDFLDVANKAAIAGVTDTAMSVNGLTTMINSFELASSEAIDVSDAMFIGVMRGKTTFAELAYAIGRVAPMAHTVGVSYTDMLATLTTATLQGIQTRESVTGMKQALQNIVRPSQEATKALAAIGVVGGEKAITEAGGWVPFLTNLREHLKSSDVQLSKIFTSVEGFNYLAAVTGAGWSDFLMILGDMDKRAGMTEQAFQKMSHTFRFVWMRFKSEFVAGWIRFGYPVLESMAAGLLVIVNILEKFNKFLSEHQRLSIVIYRTIGLLGTMLVVIGAIVAAIGMARGYILMLKVGFGELYGTIWTLGSRLFWLAAILVVLYEAYRANWAGLKDALAPFFDKLMTDVKNTTDVFTAAIAMFGKGVPIELAKSLKERGLLDDAITIYDAMAAARTGFIQLTTTIETNVIPTFRLFGYILDGIYATLQRIGGKTIFPDIAKREDLENQGQAYKDIARIHADIWGTLISIGVQAYIWFRLVKGVWGIIKSIPADVAKIAGAWGWVVGWLQSLGRWFYYSWEALVTGPIGTFFVGLAGRIAALAGSIWSVLEGIGFIFGTTAGFVLLVISLLIILGIEVYWLATHWEEWWSNTLYLLQDIWKGVKNKFIEWLNHLGVKFNEFGVDWGATWNNLEAIFVTLLNDMLQLWIDLWTGKLMIDAVMSLVRGVEDIFTSWNPFINFGLGKVNAWMGPNAINPPAPLPPEFVGPPAPPLEGAGTLRYGVTPEPEQHATGGIFTKTGLYSGIFHKGEIVTPAPTTKKLSQFADKISTKRGTESVMGRQTVSFHEGAVSLVVNVANGKDINTDELADRLFDSIKAKMKELSDRTFRSDEGFSPGVSYG